MGHLLAPGTFCPLTPFVYPQLNVLMTYVSRKTDVAERERETETGREMETHAHTLCTTGFRECSSFTLLESFPKFVSFLLILPVFLLLI